MRRVLLGLIGVMAAGPGQAEIYSFTTLVNGVWPQQTLIYCQEPARMNGRRPERCTLSEQATAYPNRKYLKPFDPGVTCAAGHPITFHADGTLAYCKLEGVQTFATRDPPGFATCSGYVTFDPDGIAECD
jgi:hypothetical protein